MQDIKQVSNTNLITASIPVWCSALGTRLHLPLIQRNFVWKPEQIAFLWDSILRGFPLGTLLVVPVKGGVDVKQSSKIQTVHDGWLLLDGQQRSRAIKGGIQFHEENGFRVWVGVNSKPANPKLLFDVKVTTQQHPFGFDSHFKPLRMHQRMMAYDQFEQEQAHKEKPLTLGLTSSRPYSANGTEYFPIDSFFNKSRDYSLSTMTNSPALQAALEGVKRYQIVATTVEPDILFETNDTQYTNNDDANLPVELLFERVGSGGTRLSNEDYAYSLIKQRMPDAHIVVEHALRDPDIGALFSPLSIISIALRLSCSFSEEGKRETDDIHYSKANIFQIIENAYNRKFIQEEIVEANRLSEVLTYIVCSLSYRSHDNPYGLPVSLLRALPISFWQLLVIWKWRKPSSTPLSDNEAMQLIAFALVWLLYSPNTKTARRITRSCVAQLREDSSLSVDWLCEQFCSHIHDEEGNQQTVYAGLFSPEDLQDSMANVYCQKVPTLKSKSWRLQCLADAFETPENAAAATKCFSSFWYNKKLLLWFQRHYLNNITEQKKVKISSHITPFDYDHIIPQNYWAKASTSKGKQLLRLPHYDYKTHHNAHLQLGNSIGNYQLLSFADNRAKQDVDYQDFIEGFSGNPKESLFIDEEMNQAFLSTPSLKNKHVWNDATVVAFQSAVELRICGLYTAFYDFMKSADLTAAFLKTR